MASYYTFRSRSNDGLQDLLVVKDQYEALGRANDQRRRNVETRRPAKVALADFREDLARDLLQLGPPHDFPWRL